jgi:hypothetical protein
MSNQPSAFGSGNFDPGDTCSIAGFLSESTGMRFSWREMPSALPETMKIVHQTTDLRGRMRLP